MLSSQPPHVHPCTDLEGRVKGALRGQAPGVQQEYREGERPGLRGQGRGWGGMEGLGERRRGGTEAKSGAKGEGGAGAAAERRLKRGSGLGQLQRHGHVPGQGKGHGRRGTGAAPHASTQTQSRAPQRARVRHAVPG